MRLFFVLYCIFPEKEYTRSNLLLCILWLDFDSKKRLHFLLLICERKHTRNQLLLIVFELAANFFVLGIVKMYRSLDCSTIFLRILIWVKSGLKNNLVHVSWILWRQIPRICHSQRLIFSKISSLDVLNAGEKLSSLKWWMFMIIFSSMFTLKIYPK